MKTTRLIKLLAVWGICCTGAGGVAAQSPYNLVSPNEKIHVLVMPGDEMTFTVTCGSTLLNCRIGMTVNEDLQLGRKPVVVDARHRTVDQILKPVVREKNESIRDHYNELELKFEKNYRLIFRVYDNGVAYRFATDLDGDITVNSETVDLHFRTDPSIYYPLEEGFVSHNERSYQYLKTSEIKSDQLASLPALVDFGDEAKLLITEADLVDYPGLWLRGTGSARLRGVHPEYVLEESMKNDRDSVISKRADYLAKTTGTRSFPWRVFVVAEKDADLIMNQLTWQLSSPPALEDTSWIKPGKVAWDWWNYNNIYGVDFRAGVNTQTYKYYIDFAAEHGIKYVIRDEGWYVLGDLMKFTPDMDVEEIARYAKEKNVGLIFWMVWKTLDNQLDEALDMVAEFGAAGIKVDFMQRDDQAMVNYYHKIAREAAKRKLLVDFHGAYKPTGLRRAYPNVITREGVKGLEHNKWSADVTPEHNVTLPFIRMAVGPMDYTPGAMINAAQADFHDIFNRPMSQGTRCHQLAMYVIYESPVQMLADSPTHYLREPECLAFLSDVPTVWDETVALDAKVADYVVLARRHGDDWYIGAMTDWTERSFTINCSFLGDGAYQATIYADGINADRYGNDYKMSEQKITKNDLLDIKCAPGGGWVARLVKQ